MRHGHETDDLLRAPREVLVRVEAVRCLGRIEDAHVEIGKGDWAGTIYVNNIADERGVLISSFYRAGEISVITPRTIGFTLSRKF